MDRDGNNSPEVVSDSQHQATITDSDDIPLARLQEKWREEEKEDSLVLTALSDSEVSVDSPARGIVLPASPRYPQRKRKTPAYLKDYCAVTANGERLRVSYV